MHDIVENQRKFFQTHVTRDVEFRIRALKKLQKTIREWEPRIAEALHADLGKSAAESYMCEIGLVLGVITQKACRCSHNFGIVLKINSVS